MCAAFRADGGVVVGVVIGTEESVPTEAEADIINTYKVPGAGCGWGGPTSNVGLEGLRLCFDWFDAVRWTHL